MIRRVFASPRDHLMLALPLLTLCGCAMCQDCFDEYYAAYGGRRPRTDMVHGRVGSIIDPATEADVRAEIGIETPRTIESPLQPRPLDASGSHLPAEPSEADAEPTEAADTPTEATDVPTEASQVPTDAAEMPMGSADEPTDAANGDQGTTDLDLSSPFDVEPPTSSESSFDPSAT